MAKRELALLQSQLARSERIMRSYLENQVSVQQLEEMVACMRSTYAQALEQARGELKDMEFDAEVSISSRSCHLLV
jgi:hypothetical protein